MFSYNKPVLKSGCRAQHILETSNGGLNMKLAEALILKEDYKEKIEELKYRLNDQVLVREGDNTELGTIELLDRIEEVMSKLHHLERRIHEACVNVAIDDKHTLNDMVQERNYKRRQYRFLHQLLMNISIRNPKFTRPELRFVPTVSVKELEEKVDAAKKGLNELEGFLQRINWEVEV